MTHTVICGDCIQVLPTLGQFNFTFADPPFNLGVDYGVYTPKNDKRHDYFEWCLNWIKLAWEHTDGVLCLHGPDNLAEIYLYAGRQFGMSRIAWINWHYRFGVCNRTNWIDARCHCIVFAKDSYTWNLDDVLVPSDRAVVYGDRRVHDTARGGWRLPGTIWGVPSDGPNWGRVQGNNSERRPLHPNQLPEVYLERLIRAYTSVGDSVLDPFGGSGTTATVAAALSREYTTIELNKAYCVSIEERIKKGMVRR